MAESIETRWEAAKPQLIAAANTAGIDVGIMVKIAGFESQFNSAARPIARDDSRNKVTQFDGEKAISSAYGYGQFLNGTWQTMINTYGEKYGVANAAQMSKSEANAPELRTNTALQAAMLAEFTRENIQKGARLGGADADANVYAFHNLGDGDASKFLKAMKANPDQRADAVLSADVINGNPALYGDGSRSLAESYKAMGQQMDKYEKYALDATQGIASPNQAQTGATVPTKAPADPMADGVLQLGEKGPAVKKLQEQLIAMGYKGADGKPLSPDSDFGKNTKFAVEAFQRAGKIGVDGKVGEDTFEALKKAVPAQAPTAPTTPTQGGSGNGNWPAPGNFKINDADKQGEGHGEFGTPRSNRSGKHSGLDIEGKRGDPIEPFAAGKVVYAGIATGYGNTVVIDHGNGQRTLYAHLDKINVQNGQTVTPDTKIATMGRSGNTPSTGDTHLHFEIRTGARAGEPFSGKAVDPLPYLNNSRQISPAAGSQNAMSDGVLKQGERGTDVTKVQEQLNALGFKDAQGKALIPDGDFGSKTKQAVEAFQRARGLVDDGIVGKDTFSALKKTEAAAVVAPTPPPVIAAKTDQSPLLSSPNHPDHAMYKQALAGMEKLPASTFKSEQERQNAAASVAFEAKVSGLNKIDNVALSTNGSGLFAVQGAMNDPAHHRIYVDKTQAAAQPVEKSTQQMQQDSLQSTQLSQTSEQQRKTVVM